MKVVTMKKRITLILAVTSLVISIGFLVTLNIVIRLYIENAAKQSIELEVSSFTSDEFIYEITSENFQNNLFSVYSIVIPELEYEDNINNYDYYYSPEERRIKKYVEEHSESFKNNQIVRTNIDNKPMYIATVKMQLNWDDEFGFQYPWNKELNYETWILYVNMSSVLDIVTILNWIFFVILMISALGAIFAGIKAGSMVENAEQKLKSFFANASHELKTPLMSIQGYAEGLQTGVIQDIPMGTQVILDQSDKMTNLIEELLYLSKIESGEYIFQKQPLDLCDLADSCFSSIKDLAYKKGITVHIEISDESIIVLGDENQLYKLFMNILSNALRYAKNNIFISFRTEKQIAIICIKDDGDGISIKDLPHIFDRFYIGEKGSTGVGLSLAKEIATLHKGNISAKNGTMGAEFTIQLPLQ